MTATRAQSLVLETVREDIARFERHIAEWERVIVEIDPVKHVITVPRDPEKWPVTQGYVTTPNMVRENIAHIRRRLDLANRRRAVLEREIEGAAA
jgi:hypothetical protein